MIITIVAVKTGRRPSRSPRRPPTIAPKATPRVRAPEARPTWSSSSPSVSWKMMIVMPKLTIAAASMKEAIPETTPTHHGFGRRAVRPVAFMLLP